MMNKQPNPNQTLLQFMLRAQQIAHKDTRSDKGYAMMMTSIVSILLFSLLAAYMTMTNLSKSSTNAYVDGTNTFYASESGLNRRAEQLRQKFVGYATPSGTSPGNTTSVSAANISSCFPLEITTSSSITSNDFECRNYAFRYNNSSSTVKSSSSSEAMGGGTEVTNKNETINYTAYTFVADQTAYTTTSIPAAPVPQRIPQGQAYAGLNAQEYKYTVYSTAAKPDSTNSTQTVRANDAKTVLQMDFKSRVIPLFQFAAFYNRDLELNSTSAMTVNGWVHTNANLYIQPTPQNPTDPGTDFRSNLTAAGDLYNRVDASTITRNGAARVLMTSSPDTFLSLPSYNSARTTSVTTPEMAPFGGKVLNGTGGAVTLNPPDAGFMRKRNYYNNKIGEYFGKADLRLEMVPDRLVFFNFTAIQSGANATGDTCDTTTPTAGSDPAANYINSERGGTNFKCTQLNKGQLLSMAQPVLVLTRGNTEEEARFCSATIAPLIDRTRDIIGYGAVTANTTVAGLTTAKQDKVLRALQVAVSSYEIPLDYNKVTKTGTLPTAVQTTFGTLLGDSTLNIGLTAAQISSIKVAAPASIAKARKSCFLPAPVQQVVKGTGADGFFDRRENRQLRMVQTNIESLTVWNRDGRYVDVGTDLTTITAATNANLLLSLRSGDPSNTATADAYSTNNLLFVKAAASGTNTGSFEKLGLAAEDRTEGGLVLHATVNDDLNGNGGTIDNATDARGDSTQPIYKKNADGTNFLDSSGNLVIMDYYRRYKNNTSRQSPYGFAFNGGNNLPGPLTIVTDQAVYLQGDYNNYLNEKKPASFLADTITTLSVNCLSPSTTTDPTNILTGQINCGIPAATTGTRPWPVVGGGNVNQGQGAMYNADDTTVNAAFLSYTDQSTGNLGVGRGYNGGAGPKAFSGGLNNYMRMIEDWNGQNFNYSGSFISLGSPLEFSGPYVFSGGATSYCYIPIRNFAYDTNFDSFDKLPPLTPRAIYLQQQVFKRTY